MMYKKSVPQKSELRISNWAEGETIEQKVRRIVNNKEPIKDGAPIIFTERKDGVVPDYNIRTDRQDIAVEAMGIVAKTNAYKRAEAIDARGKKKENPSGEVGKTEPTQGTNS